MHDVTDLIRTKATLVGADTFANYETPSNLLRPSRLMVQDLMPRGQSGASGISYAQVTSAPVPPANVAEGALKNDAAVVMTHKQAKMRKAAAYQKIAEETYKDTEVLTGFVRSVLGVQLAQSIEKIIVAELITAAPTSIAVGSSAQAIFDGILAAKAAIHASGYEPDGVVMAPARFETLRKDRGSPFSIGERSEIGTKAYFDCLYNMAVVETPAIGASDAQIFVGSFAGATVLYEHSDGLRVNATESNEDDFIKNLWSIVMEQRTATAIFFLPAFRMLTIS